MKARALEARSDEQNGYSPIGWEFEEWMDEQGIEWSRTGCSETSRYYTICIDEEDELYFNLRLSNHGTSRLCGLDMLLFYDVQDCGSYDLLTLAQEDLQKIIDRIEKGE